MGATGYTGGEILRLLAAHPFAEVSLLTARSKADRDIGDIHPHLRSGDWPDLLPLEKADFSGIDGVFSCLPHTAGQEIIAGLPEHMRVIDLSADFRLRDPKAYQAWYGVPHKAPHLSPEAIYGLTEWARADLPTARLVANPGCYATAILLPLRPLVAQGLIETDSILVTASSGVSGAGRQARENLLLSQAGESLCAYSLGGHRHIGEIEQELSAVQPKPESERHPGPESQTPFVTFIPQLAPMTRGILAVIAVTMRPRHDARDLRAALITAYQESPFVHILPEGCFPATKDVRGANACHIGLSHDRVAGRAIILSVIDNLVKGAAGQAVQNMNVMFGFPETTGLPINGLHP